MEMNAWKASPADWKNQQVVPKGMRGSTDSFISPTKPDFSTLTKHQSPPICLPAKEHGIKRFTFESFFLNTLQLLLLVQWLEYILNSNIIYYAVDIDKNYEQKTYFARIKPPEVEEFYMSGVGVDFVHEWGESDWRVGAAFAVMQILYRSAVVKREPSLRVKLI